MSNHQKLKTLFVKRTLLNADELKSWARSQGFESILPDEDMHVTIAYSKQPLDWSLITPINRNLINRGGERTIQQFGDAVVLCFPSRLLHHRWQELCNNGASYDFDEYKPHVSITYNNNHQDLDGLEPYTEDLIFGPEHFAEVNENWKTNAKEDAL